MHSDGSFRHANVHSFSTIYCLMGLVSFFRTLLLPPGCHQLKFSYKPL
ncbi:hypothetical protein T4B_5773 [Trichinella pseudospiralis]|uniref:Uncharacterized protein n=1 Tax=Trichinella pseudospiralis TaxID=6337 RepID=A0A0V1G793_TRIPS|nr:hypothetical protein T4B_5773 [Trichinella pseudospiralis]